VPVAEDLGVGIGITFVPLNEKWRLELLAKPAPDALTTVPRGPLVEVNVIDTCVTVNVADALVAGDALSATEIVAGPAIDIGIVMVVLNVPVPEDFGVPAGVTFVPLNEKWRLERFAKPTPDTVTGVPRGPLAEVNVIDEAVSVMWLVSNVTAAPSEINLPFTVALVCTATSVLAIMVPLKSENVPRVAPLPTCQ
jgi:hypothetical protein